MKRKIILTLLIWQWNILFPSSLFVAAAPKRQKAKKLKVIKAKIKGEGQSYRSCRKNALNESEASGVDKGELKKRLKFCQDQYPLAVLFQDCKKAALKDHKKKSGVKALNQKLNICRKFLESIEFSKEKYVPFHLFKEKLYFAGLGFNAPIPTSQWPPQNFTCKSHDFSDLDSFAPEYLLFGNDLNAIVKGKLNKKQRAKLLKQAKDALVKIEGHESAGRKMLFLPATGCAYHSDLGSLFSGINLYYLIDTAKKSYFPYFAIAFYKEDSLPNVAAIEAAMVAKLGESFEVQESNSMKYLTKTPLDEFDNEGEARNVCKIAKNQDFIGLIKLSEENPSRVEYSLIANIKNLCRLGAVILSNSAE